MSGTTNRRADDPTVAGSPVATTGIPAGKPYRRPRLVHYGDFRSLTRSNDTNPTGAIEDSGGPGNNRATAT